MYRLYLIMAFSIMILLPTVNFAAAPQKSATYFKLIARKGSAFMSFRIGMDCPKKRRVSYLAYSVGDGPAKELVATSIYRGKFRRKINIKLYTKDYLEQVCRQALAEAKKVLEPNQKEITVSKKLPTTVTIIGDCTGWKKRVTRQYPVSMTVNCVEKLH